MYVLVVYVPMSHINEVKQAMFDQGAGKIGDYEHCCWQVEGIGQFRALKGAQPFVGEINDVHKEPEMRIELMLTDDEIKPALNAMIDAHPYEEPAYHYYAVNSALE
jgi:hypothetical protein